MKKLLLLLIIIAGLSKQSSAQTFTNSTWTPVPDNNTDILIPIVVSGLPAVIDTNFGVTTSCLYITHTFVSDLQVSLKSPTGTIITLSTNNGGAGDGYWGTCFQENAVTWITSGVAPFSGSYFPQQSLNNFNNGQNPNGTWNLIVRDAVPADTGSVHYWNITFGFNPPRDPSGSGLPCSEANPAACKCEDTSSTNCDLLPDMTASAQSILDDMYEYPGQVMMGNATPNIGQGPLEIHGIDSCYCDAVLVPCSTTACPGTGLPPKQLVSQRIYHRNGTSMTFYDRRAGTMTYHPTHGHTHVDDWAYFTIRRKTPNPDATTWPIIGEGTKQSFCLVNLGDCTSNYGYCVDNAGNIITQANIPNSNFGTVTGCAIDQGIYAGNLDIYSSGLNDPGIILPPTTCNGDYYIVSITDFNNNFLESDETNNWVAVPITLTQQVVGTFPASGFTYTLNQNVINTTATALTVDSCIWNWGDGSPNTKTLVNTAQHTFPGTGTFIVYLYAYNHCGPTVSADTVTILSVGLNEPAESIAAFNVYPNPTKDKAAIVYTLVNPASVSLEVFDAMGKQVRTMTNNQLAGKYQVEFDAKADNLPSGVYFIRLSSAGKMLNKRLTIIE